MESYIFFKKIHTLALKKKKFTRSASSESWRKHSANFHAETGVLSSVPEMLLGDGDLDLNTNILLIAPMYALTLETTMSSPAPLPLVQRQHRNLCQNLQLKRNMPTWGGWEVTKKHLYAPKCPLNWFSS